MVNVKIRRKSLDSKMPEYAHKGDAGMDLFSAADIILKPNHRTAVPVGVEMEIPDGYVGLIWDKSGISLKQGLKTMAGVVDSSYRGEIKVVILNVGSKPLEIKKGMKIAQMLIQPIEIAEIIDADNLNETDRGDRGFGSTGTGIG